MYRALVPIQSRPKIEEVFILKPPNPKMNRASVKSMKLHKRGSLTLTKQSSNKIEEAFLFNPLNPKMNRASVKS